MHASIATPKGRDMRAIATALLCCVCRTSNVVLYICMHSSFFTINFAA